MYVCRECEQPINQGSEICPYCGADLTAAPAGVEETVRKPGAAKLVLIWGAVILGLWGIVWYVLPHRSGDPAAGAESRALEALSQVRGALAAYSDTEGGFPPSLDPIADKVRATAQSAQGEGYQLGYTPGAPAADGHVHGYSLQARAGNYGFRNFYTDETGVLRATRENRPATVQDPPLQLATGHQGARRD
jgi:hypothetical protein